MNCREMQSLIVPFIKSELSVEQEKSFLEHIDECKECREELEVYYILLIGLKQLDEDPSGSLDLHRKFEEELNIIRGRINKQKMGQVSKMVLLLALIGVLLVLITTEKQNITEKQEVQKKNQIIFQLLPEYKTIRNDKQWMLQIDESMEEEALKIFKKK